MPMKFEKVREALSKCVMLLEDHAFLSARFVNEVDPPNEKQTLEHAHWMGLEVLSWGEERREKAMRWLGFIQGVLWTNRIASLHRLKEMNKPDVEDLVRTDTDRIPAPANLPRLEPDTPTTLASLPGDVQGAPIGERREAGAEGRPETWLAVGALSALTGLGTSFVRQHTNDDELADFFLVAAHVRGAGSAPSLGRLMTVLLKEREKHKEGDPGDGDNV